VQLQEERLLRDMADLVTDRGHRVGVLSGDLCAHGARLCSARASVRPVISRKPRTRRRMIAQVRRFCALFDARVCVGIVASQAVQNATPGAASSTQIRPP
jgi:hypothetical protein